ncbi:tyrosine-protein kinase JAK2-like [Diadema antillarum]|uniref:tyrosine-protein kinase JAK2-like n=1 Tax=Diadema antillarum TaxID=105358 RepID=UPI003A89835C
MTEKINIRRMLTTMPFLPSRTSSSRSHVEQTRPDSNCVEVWHYGDEKLPLQIPWSDQLNAERVCNLVAQHCGVPRLTGSLFGLYDATEKVWLCPSEPIAAPASGSEQRLVYRIRFHTLTANPSNGSSGFSLLEESVVSYMFRQYRDSFRNDEIELSTEEKLGLIVLDFMQHVKEDGINVANLNGRMRFSHFLPKSLNSGLSWWDKRKLRRKVRSALTNFGTDTLDAFSFKIMFLVSLSEETKSWGTEQFTTAKGDVYEVGGCEGVQKIECGKAVPGDSFQFEDIINITIYPSNENDSTLFQINRRSTPPMVRGQSLGLCLVLAPGAQLQQRQNSLRLARATLA